MLFNSFQYLLFLPLVVSGYFLIPHRFRWLLLLVVSYYFYMCWRMEYIILIAGTTLVDYGAGIMISRASSRKLQGLWLGMSLATNLSLLCTFKYFDFFSNSLEAGFQLINITVALPELKLLLPVGISFYTFQSMAYTIGVYRGSVEAQRHLGRFAAFISFFPQLVAGPIERPSNLIPQFTEVHKPNFERMANALNLIAFGFFKKVVVADRCAIYVEEVFSNPTLYGAWTAGMGIFLFAIQIYCDFSGYSDIARGSARLMGFELMANFDRPYLSRSIPEFWTRWHISLTNWLNEFLFTPISLQLRHLRKAGVAIAVMTTFFVSGLWHGAKWTFIVWGIYNGLLYMPYVIRGRLTTRSPATDTSKRLPGISDMLKMGMVFALWAFGLIFFRAESLTKAFQLIARLGDFSRGIGSIVIRDGMKELGILNFGLLGISLLLFFMSVALPRDLKFKYNLAFLLVTSFVILFLGRNSGNDFIYFQF
jgi:alginate O-acetyltransferase complex protein AlgI